MNFKNILFLFFGIVGLSACNESENNKLDLIRVGVTAGPHELVMHKVRELAAEQNLKVEVITFNDFIQPNVALANGDIDVNSYQHEPFMRLEMKNRGYDFVNAGKTLLMPMGFYTKAYNQYSRFPNGATFAIPNDPTNGGRALLLLQEMGFLKLHSVDLPSIRHIKENKLNLNIMELDAPQLPRSLDDVDAAVINTDWVVLSGLNPRGALAYESPESPYTNILVTRSELKDDPRIKKLRKVYQSLDVIYYVKKTFRGAVLPGWSKSGEKK